MKTSKTLTHQRHQRPLHLHMEYFFRHPYCLMAVMAFLMVAIVKSDSRIMGLMRDAYAHGFGIVGQYMREEPTRSQLPVDIGVRLPTISGE